MKSTKHGFPVGETEPQPIVEDPAGAAKSGPTQSETTGGWLLDLLLFQFMNRFV